jgi:membrane associated rhomboid family serine protease
VIPIRDDRVRTNFPVVTWTLVALNVIIFLWDRNLRPFGPEITFVDLAMQPREVVQTIRHPGLDLFPLATVFTSMFLHANVTHILGNMIFLVVFGAGVEEALGSARFSLYYLAWGVAAAAAQIWVDSNSSVPTIGASGAIGGVLGAYFLLFPTSRIEVFVPILVFLSYEISAWILLGLWFAFQILFPQQGVANWAHVGGFLAGMLTVLVLGGRAKILGSSRGEYEYSDLPADVNRT